MKSAKEYATANMAKSFPTAGKTVTSPGKRSMCRDCVMITSSATKLCLGGRGGSGCTTWRSNHSSGEIRSTHNEVNCCSHRWGGPTNWRILNAEHLRMLTWSMNQVRTAISKSLSCTLWPSLEKRSMSRRTNAGSGAGASGTSSSSLSEASFASNGIPAIGLSWSNLKCETGVYALRLSDNCSDTCASCWPEVLAAWQGKWLHESGLVVMWLLTDLGLRSMDESMSGKMAADAKASNAGKRPLGALWARLDEYNWSASVV